MMWLKEQREVHNRRISLTLRGEEIPRPIAYDLDKGWVDLWAVDEDTRTHIGKARIEGPIEAAIVDLK